MQSTEVFFSTAWETAKELWSIKMAEYTRETGSMISEQVAGMKGTQMETGMKGNSTRAKLTVREFITGTLGRCLMESGDKGWRKEMASGKELMETRTLGNGWTRKLTGTGSTHGRMEIDTRESGRTVWSMDREQTSLPMEMCTLGSISKASLKERDATNGRMGVCTQALSKTAWNMGEEYGRKEDRTSNPIVTKASILWTTNMAMESLDGLVATSTRETILMTSDTGMEKCTGLMVVSTKASGQKASNMVMEKCSFRTVPTKLGSLKIMSSREQ